MYSTRKELKCDWPLEWKYTPHAAKIPINKSAWQIPKEEIVAAIEEFERRRKQQHPRN